MSHENTQMNFAMTIRRMDLTNADRDAVRRLAERDSHTELDGPVIGAEVEGRLLAAISLQDGEAVADPFSRTAEVLAMLRLRAEQIARRGHGRSHRRKRGARIAIGGSPAGSVLSLPHWG